MAKNIIQPRINAGENIIIIALSMFCKNVLLIKHKKMVLAHIFYDMIIKTSLDAMNTNKCNVKVKI